MTNTTEYRGETPGLHSPRLESIRALALACGGRMEDAPAADNDAGASSDDGQPASATPPTTTPAASDPAPANPSAQNASEPEGQGDNADKLKRALDSEREMRKDAEKRAKAGEDARTEAERAQQKTLDDLAKALGFKSDDPPPDPAALQQTVAARDTRIAELETKVADTEADRDAKLRQRDVELAAWRLASKQGANVAALLDSRTFLTSVAAFDPAGETFAADLDAAVKKALADNPALRAVATPTPGEAGIGSTGARHDAAVTPGAGRLRKAYST